MHTFCENCREIVEYSVSHIKMKKVIRGVDIEYIGKIAYCNECGSEVFVHEIRDYNLFMLDKGYRDKRGLVSVSEIKDVLNKYNIGKRPLSLLLGWGEGTLTRYVDGFTPTKQYSDILKKIMNSSSYFKELLEINKNRITERAYKKCKNALKRISKDNDHEEKIDFVVKYLLKNTIDITPLALQKLLYFSQGFNKAFTGVFLFNDDCEAWVHGPVYRNIYYKYKDRGYNPIEEEKYEYENIKLTTVEKELLDNIIKNFGCYSGKVLEEMTHSEEPWRITRIGLNDDESSNRIIEKNLISQYFDKIKEKHNMLSTFDIRDYSTELFSKLYS